MWLDLAIVAAILIWENIQFRHFEPLPVIYVHGVWLPRHGVNGWTAEPREKYYALRGWKL